MFTEDLSVFFNASELGTNATLNGLPVTGIFEAGFEHASFDGFGSAGTSPAFTLPSASVPTDPHGLTLVVATGPGAGTYRVSHALPDGSGVTILHLLT